VAEPDGTIDPLVADQQWATSTNLSKPLGGAKGGVPQAHCRIG
jgi:hypothetical protein